MSEIEKIELETQIRSVIVYQKGVQITLEGTIQLDKGEQLIKITSLPETLDKESIRVKGIGKGKIVNITVEFNSKKEYKTEDYEQLHKERENLDKQVKRAQLKLDRLNEQIEKLKSTENEFFDNWAKAFAFGDGQLNNFIEFNENINKNFDNKLEETEKLEDEIKVLKTNLQVINNKISKLGPIEEIHSFYDVIINIDVMGEGDFTIQVRYTMNEAWWIPFYDVSLSENMAKLIMMANIYNRTGTNWENVALEISTASLKPIRLIKPDPMILEEYVPIVYEKKLSPKRKAKKLDMAPVEAFKMKEEMDMDDFTSVADEEEGEYMLAEEPAPEIEETYAEVSENIGVQSFKIQERIDIPSDKNPHPVNLTVQELETEKYYFWSSSAPENVIIRDTLINNDLLLLAGNVKIYYEEEFLGETSISVIAPKEKFKLGTRVSYDLRIDKKLIDRSKAKKAIKGKLKNNYEYKLSIKNLNKITEDLTIYDKIPHASSENIKVEIEAINLEPDKKQLGVLKWKFNLKGIEDKTLQYKYYIEYKKGITITPSLP